MKRKIFKGVINGETFNTVESYNEALKAAVDAGRNIDAHTSYEFIDTTEERKITRTTTELDEILPAMNIEATMQKIEEHKGDQKMVDDLEDQLAEFTNALFEIPDEDIYKKARLNLGQVAQLRRVADKQDEMLNDKYAELVRERDLIDRQLNTISIAATMLDSFRNYYGTVERHINRVIEKNEENQDESTQEPKHKLHKCNKCRCEKEETFTKAIDRLEKEFYDKLSPENKKIADQLTEQLNNIFGLI